MRDADTDDAEEVEIYRQEVLFAKKKDTLRRWLAKLEEQSLQAEKDGNYTRVSSYDLCKQILEAILRTLIAQDCNSSYLSEKGLQFQIRKEMLRFFLPTSQRDIVSLLAL